MPARRLDFRPFATFVSMVFVSIASACSGSAGTTTGNCTSDIDCAPGLTCSGGYCRGCTMDSQCPAGQSCVRSGTRSACVATPSVEPCEQPADYCAAAREALGTAPIACIGNTELDCSSSTPVCRVCPYLCGAAGCDDMTGDMGPGDGDDAGGSTDDAGGSGDDAGGSSGDAGTSGDGGGGSDGGGAGDAGGGGDAGPGVDAGPAGVCGNAIIEAGEGCDPPVMGGCGEPSCSAACLIVPPVPVCGNGCVDGEEECGEDGLPECADGFLCLECTCQAPRCGDGIAQPGEYCGEPGRVCGAGKTCVDCQCTPAVCGDGFVDLGEQCGEPGLATCPAGQMCSVGSCRCEAPAAFCGNGMINPGETCGEPGLTLCGAGRECVGCVCRNECGNGEVNAGEDCGEPGVSCAAGSSCNVATCRCRANCGNGAIDPGEMCDPPTTPSCASPTYCTSTCQTLPRPAVAELCNGIDDNCNGMIDEGLRDICFECNDTCTIGSAPPAGGWVPGPTNSSGVVVDMGGALTLGRRMSESYAVWIANTDEATVSKLDSRTGNEIALYPTVSNLAPAGTRPWNEACTGSTGNCPSRTAVDQNFDAYIANRAFGNQGSVTKYANAERDCVDRNMNGMIDTSRDINGNGRIDRGTAEFVGLNDECILWNVAVGSNNAVPRAIAVGTALDSSFVGDVWVGLYNTAQACRLNPANGALIGCVSLTRPGGSAFRVYGAAAYRDGRIFFARLGWSADRPEDILAWVSPTTMTTGWASNAIAPVNGGSYGMAVDGNDHVWVAGAHSSELKRYDVLTDTWGDMRPARAGCPTSSLLRGVAADATYVWSADFDRNVVWQVRISDSATMNCWPLPAGVTGAIGTGVSFDGSVWAISNPNNRAVRIAVTDPVAGTGVTTSHPVGARPYTYSDFIGFGLNTFAEPRGYYRYVVTGCDPGRATRWQGIRFTGEVPPRTSVTFFVRSAHTIPGLATEAWIGPFTGNPANLQLPPGPVPDGRFLEVEIRLASDDRGAAPRVFSVDVANTCIDPG